VLNPSKRWFNVILIDLIDVLSWSLWNLHPLCKNSSDWPMVQGLKCVGDRPQLGRLWTTHHWRLPSGYLALCPRRSKFFMGKSSMHRPCSSIFHSYLLNGQRWTIPEIQYPSEVASAFPYLSIHVGSSGSYLSWLISYLDQRSRQR
jgi:hypothetical protein